MKVMKQYDYVISWFGTGAGWFADSIIDLSFIEVLQCIILLLTGAFTIARFIKLYKKGKK